MKVSTGLLLANVSSMFRELPIPIRSVRISAVQFLPVPGSLFSVSVLIPLSVSKALAL